MPNLDCNACFSTQIHIFKNYKSLKSVTSDCKPWIAPNIELGICKSCGLIQKNTNSKWKKEAEKIYSKYSLYHQGEGLEQKVLSDTLGLESRSQVLINRLGKYLSNDKDTRILDYGYGKGIFLKNFKTSYPNWKTYGYEQYSQQEKNNNDFFAEELYHGNLRNLKKTFNAITLVHVIEHIPNLNESLESIAKTMDDQSVLFIQCPDVNQNPFDLMVMDHCSHFTSETLKQTLQMAGFDPIQITSKWISKELSCVAKKSKKPHTKFKKISKKNLQLQINQTDTFISWLEAITKKGKELSKSENFGIFGTAIAGTWLANALDYKFDFFIDEDKNRVGKEHLKKKILSPEGAPTNSRIFLALAPVLANKIYKRLSARNLSSKYIKTEKMR